MAGSGDELEARRPRSRGGGRIKLLAIWERDGGICWLCKDYVDLEFEEGTRDHIVTHAQGGSNWPWNLRLAHRECNELRGNPDPSQVAIDILLSRADLTKRKPI